MVIGLNYSPTWMSEKWYWLKKVPQQYNVLQKGFEKKEFRNIPEDDLEKLLKQLKYEEYKTVVKNVIEIYRLNNILTPKTSLLIFNIVNDKILFGTIRNRLSNLKTKKKTRLIAIN